jgi:hypothetical protein
MLPGDGLPNNNQAIGPFCCTGETAIVTRNDNNPVGYIYFYSWRGQSYNFGSGSISIAPDMEIPVSGLADMSDLKSEQIKSSVYFAAQEMNTGNWHSTQAGQLYYKVTILRANVVTRDNMPYFVMGTVSVKVDVSLNPF